MSTTLNEMTQRELGALAQRLRIKGYSRMRVTELRAALEPFFLEVAQDSGSAAEKIDHRMTQLDVRNYPGTHGSPCT